MKNKLHIKQGGRPGKVFVVLMLVFMYLPIAVLVLYSFNSTKTASWGGFTLDWYHQLFHNRILGTSLVHSLTLMAWSCAGAAVMGTLGAVGMSVVNFKGKGLLEGAVALPIMIPEIILGMAYLVSFVFARIPFGMFAMVLAHITFCIPYVYINVSSRLAGMDKSIGEAALDLGASPMRMFFDITLPMIAPAVLSGMLIASAMSLDDVVISFFVTGPQSNTLPLQIYSMLKVGVTPEINALCTLMLAVLLMVVAVVLVARRRKKAH